MRREGEGISGEASGGGTPSIIWARVTLRSASTTTSLIRRQLARTPHWSSIVQLPVWMLHSVMPSGPSMASTTSMRLMETAGRASR